MNLVTASDFARAHPDLGAAALRLIAAGSVSPAGRTDRGVMLYRERLLRTAAAVHTVEGGIVDGRKAVFGDKGHRLMQYRTAAETLGLKPDSSAILGLDP